MYAARIGWLLVAAMCAEMLAGCGVVYQGTTQQLTVTSEPAGAEFAFSNQTGTTPSTLTLARRRLDWTVYRVAQAGYQPACAIVYCGTPRWIRIADSIPLAIPLLIDVAAGTLFNCEQPPALQLQPLQPTGVAYQLPSDQQVMDALRRHRLDMCAQPYLYDATFTRAAERIAVSSNVPDVSYIELGPVSIGQVGNTVITAVPLGEGFTTAGAQQLYGLAATDDLTSMLQSRALFEYGDAVDAIVNVTYQTNARADVYASGLAVQYAVRDGDTSAPSGSTAERLRTLRDLFHNGDISEAEYDRKREEILRGL
jgi:hypothetical protein